MKKIIALSMALLLILFLFAACASKPPEGVDAAAAEAKAQEVLDTMNARDYETLTALFREDLQDMVPPETWEAFNPVLDEYGTFEKYGNISFADKGETEYGHLFSAVVECTYQNNTATMEVVMDTDLQLTGLSILQVR